MTSYSQPFQKKTDFVYTCGCTKPISQVKQQDRHQLLKTVWLHYVILRPHAELEHTGHTCSNHAHATRPFFFRKGVVTRLVVYRNEVYKVDLYFFVYTSANALQIIKRTSLHRFTTTFAHGANKCCICVTFTPHLSGQQMHTIAFTSYLQCKYDVSKCSNIQYTLHE